jgi:hypothetical protein
MPTNDQPTNPSYDSPKGDIVSYPTPGEESAKLGYETTDVNVSNVLVFIGGLFGFVIVFFFFCFFMGKVINNALEKQDGPRNKWNQQARIFAGAADNGGHRENLESNAAIEQKELGAMTKAFPGPQLQTDDGNDATYQLHAKEDLLLDNYSKTPGEDGIRIPIDRAMQLVVAKGLPVVPSGAAKPATTLAYDAAPAVREPLTSGFARTGYELDSIEKREQQLEYGKAKSNAEAQLKPLK